MSFLFPRNITVSRPAQPVTAGANGYSGLVGVTTPASETTIASGLAATIQIDRTGHKPDTKLPGDAMGMPTFKIFVPMAALTAGQVLERDVLTDDTGLRYQVVAIEWTPLGVQFRAQRLEA